MHHLKFLCRNFFHNSFQVQTLPQTASISDFVTSGANDARRSYVKWKSVSKVCVWVLVGRVLMVCAGISQ